MRGRVLVSVAMILFAAATATAQAFDAHGSARQIYATGLAGGVKATLVNASGRKVATKAADPQGGVLFRNVKPGAGYRVKAASATSDALTVISNKAAPANTGVYNQTIPSDGYGYLTT